MANETTSITTTKAHNKTGSLFTSGNEYFVIFCILGYEIECPRCRLDICPTIVI